MTWPCDVQPRADGAAPRHRLNDSRKASVLTGVKVVRLRGVKALIALSAALLLGTAVASPVRANLTEGNEINISVWNNSSHSMTAAFCPRGHVSISYKFGTRSDPCNITPYIHHFGRTPAQYTYGEVNPVGVVVRGNGKVLYFYARNPSIGRPFFEVNGQKITFVEGELKTVHVAGAVVKLHRRGDVHGVKQMIIEIAGL